MDIHTQIFLEALHKASVFPFHAEWTFFAVRTFGGRDMAAPVLLAVSGGMIGHLINWYIGRTLLFFHHRGKLSLSANAYERARKIFARYGVYALLLCWMPFFNLLSVAAGFFVLPLRKILPLLAAGLAARYGIAAYGGM